jgi:hypothetical protein
MVAELGPRRVLLVAAVLGEVQAHLADGVPRGVARPQPVGAGTAVRCDFSPARVTEA